MSSHKHLQNILIMVQKKGRDSIVVYTQSILKLMKILKPESERAKKCKRKGRRVRLNLIEHIFKIYQIILRRKRLHGIPQTFSKIDNSETGCMESCKFFSNYKQ